MEVYGAHSGLTKQENKVLQWLELGLKKFKGRILVEPGYRNKKYQEWPDFIIISPTHGVLIIECKGHYSEEIKSISNVDLLTTKGVVRYGKQLASYGCLVRDLLKHIKVPISKLVVFPEILSTDPVAIAINEFNTRCDDVRVVYNESLEWSCSFEALGVEERRISKEDYSEVLHLLNPTRVISHNYFTDSEEINRSLKLLDEQQLTFIEQIKEGHYILNGLPGTGKTIMLMKIADREMSKAKKVMITCYNNPLATHIAGSLGSDVAKTTDSLYAYHVKILGENFTQECDWKQRTMNYLIETPFDPIYDVLLIDEYQDLEDKDFTILMKLVKPDGLLVLAGDKLQNIRGSHETWKSKGINVVGKRSKFLRSPYRTTPVVVDFALKFLCTNSTLEKEAAKYFEENEFKFELNNSEGLGQRIKFSISNDKDFDESIKKIKETNPQAHILIIAPHKGLQEELSFHRSKNCRVETYLRAKGLEADIVILYNIDCYKTYENKYLELRKEHKMRSVFSALCRSRSDVYIHAKEPLDYFVELKDIYNSYLKKKAA